MIWLSLKLPLTYYFNNILAVPSSIGRESRTIEDIYWLPLYVTDKLGLKVCIEYTSPRAGIDLATLRVDRRWMTK